MFTTKDIHNVLKLLGIPAYYNGFKQITVALAYLSNFDVNSGDVYNIKLVEELYSEVAKIENTTPIAVERNIRSIAKKCMRDSTPSVMNTVFGVDNPKLTNKRFIFGLFDYLTDN